MFSTPKAIKTFFTFLTALMLTGILYGVAAETGPGYSTGEKVLAALVGSIIVLLINLLLYKLLLFLKK